MLLSVGVIAYWELEAQYTKRSRAFMYDLVLEKFNDRDYIMNKAMWNNFLMGYS